MLPKIVSTTELRKNLAHFLKQATRQIILVKGKENNKVILDEGEYNRIKKLADQFKYEDPEGDYLPSFEKEMLKRVKENSVDNNVSSLKELL